MLHRDKVNLSMKGAFCVSLKEDHNANIIDRLHCIQKEWFMEPYRKKINPKTYAIEYDSKSGFATKEEATESYYSSEKLYQNAISRVKAITQSAYTFVEYLEYWHEHFLADYTDSSSQLKYFWVIYKIIMPKIHRDILLSMLTDTFINDLIAECKNYSSSAGEMTYKVLKVILKEAEKSNLISSKVLQGITPCYGKNKKIVLYNKEQVSSFVRTAKIYHTYYFEILLALIYGLRTGEILGLKYSDFHKKSHTLSIERQYTRDYHYEKGDSKTEKTSKGYSSGRSFKPPKTLNSNRCLIVPPVIFEELKIRKKENERIIANTGNREFENYVCLGIYGNIKSDSTLNAGIKSIAKTCNLPSISMHTLRHMCATALIELNTPLEKISEVLGHKNVNTTFDIYCGIMDGHEQIKTTVSGTMDPAISFTNHLTGGAHPCM